MIMFLAAVKVLVLAVIAGDAFLPHHATTAVSAKRSAERTGITNMGFNLALRRLLQKKLVLERDVWNEQDGESYDGLAISDAGWSWIDTNDSQFVLSRQDKPKDDLPF